MVTLLVHNHIDSEDHTSLGQQLSHIRLIGTSNPLATHSRSTEVQGLSTGAGHPPVPAKLVNKIESGAYMDMLELLPERLDTTDSEDVKSKRKKRSFSILEWLQWSVTYLCHRGGQKTTTRLADLMEYQSLIIEAHMEYKNDCWIGYDSRFQQQAASSPCTAWSTIDTKLWNLAFAGHTRIVRCKHCFSLVYQSTDCNLSPEIPNNLLQKNQCLQFCFCWNKIATPTCPYPIANINISAIYVHRTQLI